MAIGRRCPGWMLFLVGAICVLSLFLVSVLFDSRLQVEPIDDGTCVLFDTGWSLFVDGELKAEEMVLPMSVRVPRRSSVVRIDNMLPDPLPTSNACLSIGLGMSLLEVFVDGVSVYRFDAEGSPWRLPFYGGRMPHFVRIADDAAGKPISLVMESSAASFVSRNLSAPVLGTKVSALFMHANQEWLSLFFGFTFSIVGIACLFGVVFVKRVEDRRSLKSFGALELVLGIWVLTQGRSKFLFARNPAVPMDFSCLALFLLPVCLAGFYSHTYRTEKSGDLFLRISFVFPVAYCVIGILQLCGVLLYCDTLMFAGAALGLYVFSMLLVSILHLARGARSLLSFVVALSLLFASVLADEILLVEGVVLDNATLLHLAMTIGGIVMFGQSLRNITSGNRGEIRDRMLFELAYTDALTGLGNRALYDKKIIELEQERKCATGIIVADINDFKVANDAFGHDHGDHVLQEIAQELREMVPPGVFLFRTGGDEFVIMLPGIDARRLASLESELYSRFHDTERIVVAIGSYLYAPANDESMIDAICLADDAMYRDKAWLKGRSRQG